jgi:uncharacterized protein YjbI with pentapeptide repeats
MRDGRLRGYVAGATDPIEGRGVAFSEDLLARLRRHAPAGALPGVDFANGRFDAGADFSNMGFTGAVRFDDATFGGDVSFEGASFSDSRSGVSFTGATFDANLSFRRAKFGASPADGQRWDPPRADFKRVEVAGDASFDGVEFNTHEADFEVTFHGWATFTDACFERGAWFVGTRCKGLGLSGAEFRRHVWLDGLDVELEFYLDGCKFPRGATFDSARFGGRVAAAGLEAAKPVSFEGAAFGGDVHLEGATFERRFSFNEATFGGAVHLEASTFGDSAWFASGTRFDQAVSFDGANFYAAARFDGADFGSASFRAACFHDRAWFPASSFRGHVAFDDAEFEAPARFSLARVEATGTFARARMVRARFTNAELHRVAFEALVEAALILDGVRAEGAQTWRFERVQSIRMNGADASDRLELFVSGQAEETMQFQVKNTRFDGGAFVHVRSGDIVLDRSSFGEPSTITSTGFSDDGGATGAAEPVAPRLLSTRGTDFANLTLADLDLRSCLFAESQNLDKLRLTSEFQLHRAPMRWHWLRTRRLVLADEIVWRSTRPRSLRSATRGRPDPWRRLSKQVGSNLASSGLPGAPGEIARLYRNLRIGREESGDAPGASDFYYGEMEMKRLDHGGPGGGRGPSWVDRLFVRIYRWISGYGLRVSRALVALAIVMALFTAAVRTFGVRPHCESQQPAAATATNSGAKGNAKNSKHRAGKPPATSSGPATAAAARKRCGKPTLGASARLATRAAAPLGQIPPRDAGSDVTGAGFFILVLLRLAGPLLIGLAVLAIRSRVKR